MSPFGDETGMRRAANLKLFVVLACATLFSLLITVPAIISLTDPAQPAIFSVAPMSPQVFAVQFVVGNLVIGLVFIALGMWLERRTGLGMPVLRAWLVSDGPAQSKLKRVAKPSVVFGSCMGLGFLSAGYLAHPILPAIPEGFILPPVWQGLLLMLGAAVREELLFRFAILNLLVWLIMKLSGRAAPNSAILWGAIVVSSCGFSLAHIVPAIGLLDISAVAGTLIFTAAALGGILLGWVFVRNGLLAAVLTHVVAGLIVYSGARILMATMS